MFPVKPQPHDGSAGCRSPVLTLQWLPGYQAVSHRVYLGSEPQGLELIEEVTQVSAVDVTDLKEDHDYVWRVDAVQADGSVVQGIPWQFSTYRLVGWWSFDQVGGGIATDQLKRHHGTLFNMDEQNLVIGIQGNAFYFDGVDDYVEIPRLIQDDWTISFWMKTATMGPQGWGWWAGHGLIDGDVDKPRDDFGTALLNGKVYYGVAAARANYPGEIIHSESFVNDDAWHHVVATRARDTGRMELYIDGVLEAETTGPTGTKDDPLTLCVGRLNNKKPQGYYQGAIDELQLYSYVLSPEEIQALHVFKTP